MTQIRRLLFLAATWKSSELSKHIEILLPEPQAPSNYKDPVKIKEYIEAAKAKRNDNLSSIWALQDLDMLEARSYCWNYTDKKWDAVPTKFNWSASNGPICQPWRNFIKESGIRFNAEYLMVAGVNVRDILRKLSFSGDMRGSTVPYPDISDQRCIIDPISLLMAGDLKDLGLQGALTVLRLIRNIEYTPGVNIDSDMTLTEYFVRHHCLPAVDIEPAGGYDDEKKPKKSPTPKKQS